MELTNWKNGLGKLKSGGMADHTFFSMEKRVEDEENKKLVHLTQSSFSICLKTLKKQGIKQKKHKGTYEDKNKLDLIPWDFPCTT